MKKRDIHVVPHNEGWATKREGSERVSKHFDLKTDATNSGRNTAKREGTELVIHDKKGVIRDSDSYGRDPNPPKDKKH